MCLAREHIRKLKITNEEMREDLRKLRRKQSEYDKKLSDFYHDVEKMDKIHLHPAQRQMVKLQEIVRTRRLVKQELDYLQLSVKRLTEQIEIMENELMHKEVYHDKYIQDWNIDKVELYTEILS